MKNQYMYMKIQNYVKSTWAFLKNMLHDPKMSRINTLLGILLFPFSGFLLFLIKPMLSSQQFQNVSILFALFTILILFLCVLSQKSLDYLSYLFRFGLRFRLVQFVLSLFVKLEVILMMPFVTLRILWFCFLCVYFFFLFESIAKSYALFLTISKALFTLGVIYIRLRARYFNADVLGLAGADVDALGLEVNEIQGPTFGQSIILLDHALIREANISDINHSSSLLLSPVCSKLSKAFTLFHSKKKCGHKSRWCCGQNH